MKKIVTSLVISGLIMGGLPLASSAHGTNGSHSYSFQNSYRVMISNEQVNNWFQSILNNYYKRMQGHQIEQREQQPVQQQPTKPRGTETEAAYSLSQFEKEVVTLTNAEREKNGLKPLHVDIKSSKVARIKSQDMKQNGYFSHTSPTYGSPFDMMKQFGVSYRAAGENIAMGQDSPREVVTAWMNSEGHRKNILNSSFTHIGVGHFSSGNYWTQMFISK